jgi:transposase
LKALWWDGTGLCLFAKRLEHGRFAWPSVKEGAIVLTSAQLAMLIEGLDWRRAVQLTEVARPTAV